MLRVNGAAVRSLTAIAQLVVKATSSVPDLRAAPPATFVPAPATSLPSSATLDQSGLSLPHHQHIPGEAGTSVGQHAHVQVATQGLVVHEEAPHREPHSPCFIKLEFSDGYLMVLEMVS
jgi:hypothetical protein